MCLDIIFHRRGGHIVTYEDDLVPIGIVAGCKGKYKPAIASAGLAQAFELYHAGNIKLNEDADCSCGKKGEC